DADVEDVATRFVQPGGVNLVTIEMPKGYYPNTDLNYAFFSANVNRKVTAEECGQFVSEQPVEQEQGQGAEKQQPSATPSKVTVGGIQFDAVRDLQEQSDEEYFHVFQNGACYEFALGMVSGDQESEEGAKLVNHDKVFARLEKLL